VSELPPGAHFVQLSTFQLSTCGIDPDGALWCWGRSDLGQLGLGDRDDRITPSRVGDESDWLFVGAGENVSCGLRAIDQLWCWGDDQFDSDYRTRPTQVPGAYTTLAVGHDVWCAIDTAGVLFCHPRGGEPEMLLPPAPAVKVSAVHDTVCLIDAAEQLYCFGDNGSADVVTG
jgi:alpha-tubulin suppressor-like RCC1 family protein